MKNLAIVAAAIAVLVVPAISIAQTKPAPKPPVQKGVPPPGGLRPGMPPGMMGGPMSGDFKKRMEARQKERRAKLVKDLKLTPDQAKKYDALQKKIADKRQKSFGKPGQMDMEAMRKKFDALRTEENAEMKKILTKDQFAKYHKMQEEARKKREQGGRGGNVLKAPAKKG